MSFKSNTLPIILKCNMTSLIVGARCYHGNIYRTHESQILNHFVWLSAVINWLLSSLIKTWCMVGGMRRLNAPNKPTSICNICQIEVNLRSESGEYSHNTGFRLGSDYSWIVFDSMLNPPVWLNLWQENEFGIGLFSLYWCTHSLSITSLFCSGRQIFFYGSGICLHLITCQTEYVCVYWK